MKYKPELPKEGWYVYGLFISGIPFYIGKGSGERPLDHFRPSYHGTNKWKDNIINKYRKDIEIIVISKHTVEEDAYSTEEYLISFYGLRPLGGLLVNRTTGGDGGRRLPTTEEQRIAQGVRRRRFSEDTLEKALYDFYIVKKPVLEITKKYGISKDQFERARSGKTETLSSTFQKFLDKYYDGQKPKLQRNVRRNAA